MTAFPPRLSKSSDVEPSERLSLSLSSPQVTMDDACAAPTRVDADPALQRLQLGDPGDDEKEPAIHAKQELASLAPRAPDAVPEEQRLQAAAPLAAA